MQIDNWFETIKKSLSRYEQLKDQNTKLTQRQNHLRVLLSLKKKYLSRPNWVIYLLCAFNGTNVPFQRDASNHIVNGRVAKKKGNNLCLSHSEERGVNPCKFLIKFFLGVFLYAYK